MYKDVVPGSQDVWDKEPDRMAPALTAWRVPRLRGGKAKRRHPALQAGTHTAACRCAHLRWCDKGVTAILYISGLG